MYKRSVWAAFMFVMVFAFVSSAIAAIPVSNSGAQSVGFSVPLVNQFSLNGNPGSLAILPPAAGSSALASVTDYSTTYSITTNANNGYFWFFPNQTHRVDASINSNMPSHTNLVVRLGDLGSRTITSGDQQLSTSARTVLRVYGYTYGTAPVTYRFSADLNANPVSDSRTVTMTMVSI